MPVVKKPTPLRRGPKFLKKALSDRDDYWESQKIIPGNGFEISETPSGRMLSNKGGSGTSTYYVVINGVLYRQKFVTDGPPVAVEEEE